MLKLFVKDNYTGLVREYGTDCHDALILMEDGSLHYEHLQCSVGTMFPEEGFSFCLEDGSIPDREDPYIDVGGVDAAPVVHGRWVAVPSSDMMTGKAYKCSECGKMRYGSFMPNFCQNCGNRRA